MASTWLISRRSGFRGFWGLVMVALFGAVAWWATAAAIRAPHVDSIIMASIMIPLAVMALVLALEGLASGVVKLDDQGYRTLFGGHRSWRSVLALGTGQVDGRTAPVVALRSDDRFPVTQDTFVGFADDEAERLVSAFSARLGAVEGFGGLQLGADYWAAVDAEVARAASVVRGATGREPVRVERAEFGFPGLINAVVLDYGLNDQGEGVELIVRQSTDLAVTTQGRRWLRQHRKRSGDPAEAVGMLFGEHTTEVVPSAGAGFDVLRVEFPEGKPLRLNAEEPDRFTPRT